MSHRMYLYNLDVTEASGITDGPANSREDETGGSNVRMMMEWGYELPLFFYPLFSAGTYIDAPMYNGEEGGLYTPATPGKQALSAFYHFIERHQDTLVTDIAAFQAAKGKILDYFDKKTPANSFHLDAWDVFNMSDDGSEGNHAAQARDLLDAINANNAVITAAIAADNPQLLDNCPIVSEDGGVFRNFRDLLNAPTYDYGWQVLESANFGREEPTIFSAGGLKGLKDADGNEIAPAIYDEIYGYPYDVDLAVAFRQGKAGYIDKSGKEVIPCTFDDAYDFEGNFAAVVTNGRFGVIDATGTFKLPAVYEDGHFLTEKVIAVKEHGLWGIIDPEANVLLPFQDVKEIVGEAGYDFTYYVAVAHNEEETYYTHRFKPLATGPVEKIDFFGHYYIVLKNKQAALIDEYGTVLLDYAYTHIRPEHQLQALIAESASGKGIYSPVNGWILSCEYQDVFPLKDAGPEPDGTMYIVVKQNKKSGLFATGPRNYWVLPPAYKNVKWLKEGYLGYQENKLWGVVDGQGQVLTQPLYNSINGRLGHLSFGIALGFHEKGIDVIDTGGSTRSITEEEAYDQAADYPQAFYSNQEIAQLKQFSSSLVQGLALHEEGERYKSEGRYEKALEIFERSAALGCKEAITNIGHIYENVPEWQDYEKALEYYQKAANLGEMYGMFNLGLMYLYGRGTAVSIPSAIVWLEKAAEKKYSLAYASLGDIYYLEEFGVVDNDKALAYYTNAYSHVPDVTPAIGHIYEQKKDYEQAVYYYEIAADQGSAYAKWRLACFYIEGIEVPVDVHKAMALLQEAVDECAEAHVDLAVLYMSTTFYDQDKAKEHLEAAKEAGVSNAGEYIEKYAFLWKGKQ